VALSEKLRFERLRRLHAKFLEGAERYPAFFHLACRSESKRLWEIFRPSWLTGWDGRSAESEDTVDSAEQRTEHERFWEEAFIYGQYAALCNDNFGSPAHVVWIRGEMWLGRYAHRDVTVDGERECAIDVMDHFEDLSEQAVDNFCETDTPPVRLDGPWDEVEHGRNPWLTVLYSVFCHSPELWEGDRCFRFPFEPNEVLFTIGLPFNVYLASARSIEILIDQGAVLSFRDGRPCVLGGPAESRPDTVKPVPRRLPENPDILRLAKDIRRKCRVGASKKEIALEFAEGDGARAESLLRQLRRYPHLIE